MKKTVKEAKAELTAVGGRNAPQITKKGAVSSGSTLLNLACSDHPSIGWLAGGYYYLVGSSSSGKTWLSMTCFAEAQLKNDTKDYRIIFDDVEGGAMMDMEFYFGKKVAERIEPASLAGEPSRTVEDFYDNITDRIAQAEKENRPFIYVLDSQDALTSEAALGKHEEQKAARRKGNDSAGSYGDGKAKVHSEKIRIALSGIRRTGSILIIIGQIRDNVTGMGFEKRIRSGGHALIFYADLSIWTSVEKKLSKTVRGKSRTIGVLSKVEIKKNRITGKTGKDRSVSIPIYYSMGIDDVGACVDWLLSEKYFPIAKQTIDATEHFNFSGTRDKLVQHIEENNLEPTLRKVTGRLWRQIEAQSQIKGRKRRYE